jgi:hypothetical protein
MTASHGSPLQSAATGLDAAVDPSTEAEGATAAAWGRITVADIETRPNATSSDDVLTRSSYLRSEKLA